MISPFTAAGRASRSARVGSFRAESIAVQASTTSRAVRHWTRCAVAIENGD